MRNKPVGIQTFIGRINDLLPCNPLRIRVHVLVVRVTLNFHVLVHPRLPREHKDGIFLFGSQFSDVEVALNTDGVLTSWDVACAAWCGGGTDDTLDGREVDCVEESGTVLGELGDG